MSKTLIYIIGAGRSGTTLLDIILGNTKDAISLGEINRFFKRAGVPPKRNPDSKVYKFWEDVKNELEEELQAKSNDLELEFHRNEYHSNWLKCVLSKNTELYKTILQKQYNTILGKTKESLIIESSKYPCRAINLSNLLDNETLTIKYIYLKKDPVSVVKSFQKKDLEQPSKGFLSSNIYYLVVNMLCQGSVLFLRRKGHQVASITYENLLKNRDKEIHRLSKELDMDFSDLEVKLVNDESLTTGYLFDGNRIRLKEALHLRKSDSTDSIKSGKEIFTRIFNYIVYR